MAPAQRIGAKNTNTIEFDAHSSERRLGAHQTPQGPTTNGDKSEREGDDQLLDLSDIPAGFEKIRGENGSIYVVPSMLRMYMEDKIARHTAAKTAVPTMKVRLYCPLPTPLNIPLAKFKLL